MYALFKLHQILKLFAPLKHILSLISNIQFFLSLLKELVFAVLIARNQLITLVRPKSYSLHPGGKSIPVTDCSPETH